MQTAHNTQAEPVVTNDDEKIIFVDQNGKPTGKVGPKLASHHADTGLHLAFSCYVFNSQGKLLLTQRAHGKRVWPGVWTNSVCGHPLPGESLEGAICRRLDYELGMPPVSGLAQLVGNYIYKTPPYRGIVEYEFCPIYMGVSDSEPTMNPQEVADYKWIGLDWLIAEAAKPDPSHVYSYWMKQQLELIANHASLQRYRGLSA